MTKTITWSKSTKCAQFHSFMESNLNHRQGFVYGAKDGKRFTLMIEDLNLPGSSAKELLRQMLDNGSTFITAAQPYEWYILEDFNVLATVSMDDPSTLNRAIDQRLLVS